MNVGIQMWSMRGVGEYDKQLEKVKQASFEYVEITGPHTDERLAALKNSSLKVNSFHADLEALENEKGGVIKALKQTGADFVVIPWARADENNTWKDVANRINKIIPMYINECKGVLYHNHAHEFTDIEDGKKVMDILTDNCKDLGIELDLGWVHNGKEDVLGYLKKYNSRIKVVHIKDLKNDHDGSPIFVDKYGDGEVALKEAINIAKGFGINDFVFENDQVKDMDTWLNSAKEFAKENGLV